MTPRNSKLSSRVYGRFMESRRDEKGEGRKKEGRRTGERNEGTTLVPGEENELGRVYGCLRGRYYDVQARARCSFLRAHPQGLPLSFSLRRSSSSSLGEQSSSRTLHRPGYLDITRSCFYKTTFLQRRTSFVTAGRFATHILWLVVHKEAHVAAFLAACNHLESLEHRSRTLQEIFNSFLRGRCDSTIYGKFRNFRDHFMEDIL